MPKKPDLKSFADLQQNGLPCESYKLKDLQNVAKAEKIPVKTNLKAQCQELNNRVKQMQQNVHSKPNSNIKAESIERQSRSNATPKIESIDSITRMFLNPGPAPHMGIAIPEPKPKIKLRDAWMNWISQSMSDEFIQRHLKDIHLTSDKQGRSNSIVFEAKVVCPAQFGPYPFEYKDIVAYGWQNVALKIYRQYYQIDNGGTVEKQIYQHLVNDMTQNNTCSHFINLLASHKIAMNKLILDAKLQTAVRNKLGIIAAEKDIQLTVLIMDLSNDSSTLEGMLEREKSIDNSSAKIQQYLAIIFQILYALQCCALSGIKHNDLHFRNVLVEKLKKTATVHYNLKLDDEKLIVFETDYWVRIIDFDQASVYHPLVERNFRLDLHRFCVDHNICNYTSENEHYDGYGFLFQMLKALKQKSTVVTEWIRLFISEEAEQFITDLGQVKITGKGNEKKKKPNKNDEKWSDEQNDAIMEWFHRERIHFGGQNVATNKVIEWYQRRNQRFPTVGDLLFSIIQHPFMVQKGKKQESYNIFQKITLADVNYNPFELDHFYQLIHLRPLTFREPSVSTNTSHIYIPTTKLNELKKNGIKFSESSIQQNLQLAIQFLDQQLQKLNVFEQKSILPIWNREMELLKFKWIDTTKELLEKYWAAKKVQFINQDLFISALLLSCPMYYGMSVQMENSITNPEIQKFISDFWATFDLVLPITIPALNGV